MKTDRIIMGIDPGTNIMGYGVIHLVGKEMKLLGAGIVSMEKLKDQSLKMKRIFEAVQELIDQFQPDEMAIEAPFFGKNVQSMLKLGRAQGIAMAAALTHEIPIFEYAPKKIKLSITGNGNASKEQVASMLQKLMGFSDIPRYLDATDALGAAVCHYFQDGPAGKTTEPSKRYSGWKSFLAENPRRKL